MKWFKSVESIRGYTKARSLTSDLVSWMSKSFHQHSVMQGSKILKNKSLQLSVYFDIALPVTLYGEPLQMPYTTTLAVEGETL
jgi:hypothetical protein